MIKIITTVGTSIMTNFMNEKIGQVLQDAGKSGYSIVSEYNQLIKNPKLEGGIIKDIIEKYFLFNMEREEFYKEGEFGDGELMVSWRYNEHQVNPNFHCSAEVYSVSEIIKQRPDENYEVILISTDTAIANISAELIKKALKKIQSISNITINSINDLQVDNGQLLKGEGFNNLIKCFDNIIKKDRINKVKVKYILNITGGFKGIIPLATIYALVSDITINYIYENSKSLIELKNIPLSFDWSIAEIAGPYLDNNWFHIYKKDSKVIGMLQDYGFVDRLNRITPLGFLFKSFIDEKYPEGKETLGMLVEFKLFEYYTCRDKDIRSNYKVSRSVFISDKPSIGMKGNEIDILLELNDESLIFNSIWDKGNKFHILPANNKFITVEVKGFTQVKSGTKAIDQFREFLNNIKVFWKGSSPLEIRYVTWHLLKEGLDSRAEEQIKDNLKVMQQMVKDKYSSSVIFKPYLLTIPINMKKSNIYTNMMQKRITKNDIKLIQL
jgi:putative CRISPR-associated protein (TIGR02619 family)